MQGQLNFKVEEILIQGSDVCANRHKGNENSISAHERVAKTKEATYKIILEFVEATGRATSKEIARSMNKPLHCISGRLAELKAMNRLRGTGKSREGAEILILVSREESKGNR